MKNEFLGKEISGPFTVPSGIVTCSTNIIRRFFELVPEVGVLTTKSIGPEPRKGYREPILTQYEPGSFTNAVGLTNPGVSRSAQLLAELSIPSNRFLLISIFGASIEEYVDVAKQLAPHGDGLELNLSCPHAKGLGMAMGQDPALVEEIVSSVKAARLSAGWALVFIAILFTTAPAVAAFARINFVDSIQNVEYSAAPDSVSYTHLTLPTKA